jgi:hypothetical protein
VRLPELVAHAHGVEAPGRGAGGQPVEPLLADQAVAHVDDEGAGQVVAEVLEVRRRRHREDVGREPRDGAAAAPEEGVGAAPEGVPHRGQDGLVEGEGREEGGPDHAGSTSRARGA